ncbi:MAG: hypothetical protein BWX81_02220 [Spirochaetes bacterium ADurb.Bin110]|jgi:hypothetical protein|nr:MAG: hypothetical protein BWX81_02220 [Spirochaetes bacterium ADurb.Bin110]
MKKLSQKPTIQLSGKSALQETYQEMLLSYLCITLLHTLCCSTLSEFSEKSKNIV